MRTSSTERRNRAGNTTACRFGLRGKGKAQSQRQRKKKTTDPLPVNDGEPVLEQV